MLVVHAYELLCPWEGHKSARIFKLAIKVYNCKEINKMFSYLFSKSVNNTLFVGSKLATI